MSRNPFICAINGSPRKDGCTATHLEYVVNGLRRRRARTKFIHLIDYDLKPCDGEEEHLKRYPDIDPILTDVERADGIIFGTPTYWVQHVRSDEEFP